MSRKTQKTCRLVGCDTKVNKGGIETAFGWFCSEKCLSKVRERLFKVFMNCNLKAIPKK